jgi:DNA invertase Pin-like site-specific DNA recombinase
MTAMEKTRPQHLNRMAYVYIRQSTLAQVRFQTESTERQYALQEKAQRLGWPKEAIRVIDEDLGLSGSQSANRSGFRRLVADVSLGQVGAILGLEVSRLARSSADWQKLLELCSLFDTLIIDEDGIYNLEEFNDRLVLGPKGTMSEAELHLLPGRLLGGKRNKARKGELRHPLPVGYSYDAAGRTVMDPDEQVQTAVRTVWWVRIQDHHPGYITVEEFEENKARLQQNRTSLAGSGAPREGSALLQGILLCGTCGKRMSVRYQGEYGKHPSYECSGARCDAIANENCRSITASPLDEAISQRILAALQPEQLHLALNAVDTLHSQQREVEQNWNLQLERARYEAERAERQYHLTEPENRLVARTLEKRWNDALAEVHRLEDECERQRAKHSQTGLRTSRDEILALIGNLPQLWDSGTTSCRDRKHIVRLLVEDVTAVSRAGSREFTVGIRWRSGHCETLTVTRLAPPSERRKHKPNVVELVRELAQTLTSREIADHLNAQGYRTAEGRQFTQDGIEWIRHRPSQKRYRGLHTPGVLSPDACRGFLRGHEVAPVRLTGGIGFSSTLP